VVKAYAHCCALCGIRMLTLDGHTAVDASHIKPWSLSRDDRPANGMALCKLCHWSFDKGLLGKSQRYTVMSSAQLFAHDNFSGHLSSLKGRVIGKPPERMHWPDPDSLRWHRREVFRAL
jgi:putative restriction endonuclease